MNHFRFFNSGDRGASAHYFVDSNEIVQIVRDEDISWHCGDGRGRFGITNRNSIGVEMCMNDDFEKVFRSTAKLVAKLLNKHSLDISRVKKHYDASRKNCPASIINSNRWDEFLALVLNFLNGTTDDNNIGVITASVLNIRQEPTTSSNIVGTLQRGSSVQLLGESGDFFKIDRGYIHKNFVRGYFVDNSTSNEHWALSDFNELNNLLESNGVPTIQERRFDDKITRGEVIRMLNLLSKTK